MLFVLRSYLEDLTSTFRILQNYLYIVPFVNDWNHINPLACDNAMNTGYFDIEKKADKIKCNCKL